MQILETRLRIVDEKIDFTNYFTAIVDTKLNP